MVRLDLGFPSPIFRAAWTLGLLPPATLIAFALAMGCVGTVLYRAGQTFDYSVIYGVVFIVILASGLPGSQSAHGLPPLTLSHPYWTTDSWKLVIPVILFANYISNW